MRKTLGEKRIPTLVALLVIIGGIFGTSFLVQGLKPFRIGATPAEEPREIKITNVTARSLAVSWITQEEVRGSLRFWEKEGQGLSAVDDRDRVTGPDSYKTHHVTLQDLHPETQYSFNIISGHGSYDNNGTPYKITTTGEIDLPAEEITPIRGTVINEDGSPVKEALVYASAEGAQPLSATTSQNGDWSLSQPVRTADLANYYKTTGQLLNLLITNGEKSSTVLANFDRSLASVILGQNYDFTVGVQEKETTSLQKAPSRFQVTPSTGNISLPKILNPKKEESFVDLQPRFSGTAPKGTTIKITIESPAVLETSVKADNNGNWSYRPQAPLSPGDHTITIVAPDSSGILRTITRSFRVFAAGSQVEEPATPSATPITSLSPTPSPTMVIQPTTTPTALPIPTKAPQPIPVTGETLPLITLGLLGAISFLVGLALLF